MIWIVFFILLLAKAFGSTTVTWTAVTVVGVVALLLTALVTSPDNRW